MLKVSTQNILYSSKFIETPLEALGLIIHSISRINPRAHKSFSIKLNIIPFSTEDADLSTLLEKSHLVFTT